MLPHVSTHSWVQHGDVKAGLARVRIVPKSECIWHGDIA
nr:MAG TPA: hypothetical protein [Caudoviricetes sp.]